MRLGRTKRQPEPETFDPEKIRQDILSEARSVGIPVGAVEPVAEIVASKVAGWASRRTVITDKDLNQHIAAEIKKYNPDLAYVYENRGKII